MVFKDCVRVGGIAKVRSPSASRAPGDNRQAAFKQQHDKIIEQLLTISLFVLYNICIYIIYCPFNCTWVAVISSSTPFHGTKFCTIILYIHYFIYIYW